MEASLMVEGIGPWKNFDEIEDSLVLDELLLLHEMMGKSKHHNYRMLASFQGIEMADIEDSDDGESLPEEILEADRKWKAQKAEYLREHGEDANIPEDIQELKELGGFGYQRQ